MARAQIAMNDPADNNTLAASLVDKVNAKIPLPLKERQAL